MELKFTNSTGDLLLPRKAIMTQGDWTIRTSSEARYGRPGGTTTGDWNPPSRTVSINLKDAYTTDALFSAFAETLVSFMGKNYAPHYLVDVTNSKRTLIIPRTIPMSWEEGLERRVVTTKMDFEMQDAFWESLTETSDTWNAVTDASEKNFTNAGKYETYPVFEIEAVDSVFDFKLENLTSQQGIWISSFALTAGTKVIIDPRGYGSIKIGNDTIGYAEASIVIAGGNYPFFAPGVNTLRYTSAYGSVNIVTKWRTLYAW